MLPLVEIPDLVRHYAPFFAGIFSAEAFEQFQRYISGLILSENKTVEGINRSFVVDVRNQSSLNRLLTASPFSVEALNRARLELLASLSGTRMKPKGVLSLDDTLRYRNFKVLLAHGGWQEAKLFSLTALRAGRCAGKIRVKDGHKPRKAGPSATEAILRRIDPVVFTPETRTGWVSSKPGVGDRAAVAAMRGR